MPDRPDADAPPPNPLRAPAVVYFREEGTIYDVPVDVLWEFMNWEGHGAAHEKSGRAFHVLEEAPHRVTVSHESFRGGEWRKVTSRVVAFPPLGRLVEEIDGLYKGTQMVFLYTPVGERTRLDIIARFASEALPVDVLERHMVDSLRCAGVEDEPYLQEFVRARSHR